MVEKMDTSDKNKQQAKLLLAVGIVLAIIGVLEFEVPGMPFRGSGIGTICLFLGALLLAVGYVRLNSKATK
ncbi:MAG: hypothetical protein ABSA11_12875 [Candidatus Bathyarchaeia archaeon]|jgi:uncharacterized membrane protein HdeD (DUF308 family)